MSKIIQIKTFLEQYKFLLIFDVILADLGISFLFISNVSTWFLGFFFLTIVQLILHIYYLYKLEHKIITFPIIFFLLSYVFTFGHISIQAFNFDFGTNVLFPLWYINFNIYKEAAIFSFITQMTLFFGVYFFFVYKNKSDRNKENVKTSGLFQIPLRWIRMIGVICFLIGIVPTLYIDISRLLLFIQGGYLNTYNLNVHDFVEIIANFFNFSIFSLVIGFSNNKKVANSIFISAVIYKVIMMSSGGRGEAIVFLLGLFIVWENLVMQLSAKQIIVLIVIGYLGLVLLNFIATVRTITTLNITDISQVFLQSLTNNQLVSALSEFGSTFATVCFTMNSKPGPTLGLNYILPIILIIPNIGGFNSGVVDHMIFTKHIETFNQPIGGSYIGELFYSFHWFGCLFAIFLGILIGYIYYKTVIKKQDEKNYFSYLLFSYITPLLFFWIRGYFGAIYREYIWHCGLAIILIVIGRYLQKKRKKGEIRWLH
ncbi:O-antigen polysaccharide polymerase Wzy family protein [[Clostridium] innocuum]|nr:O-antigen polysaccharide polymerase Wzy family protein [[Clostridium] innocuum]